LPWIDADTKPDEDENLLRSLAQDGLFLATLEKTLNTDYEFEGFLRKLRRFILFECRANKNFLVGFSVWLRHWHNSA